MRITGNRIIELAAAANQRIQGEVGDKAEELSSGMRVVVPSDDPAAWIEGRRASIRQALSEGRGDAIARSKERLVETDRALDVVGGVVSRAREIAISAANAIQGPDQRAALALEVRSLFGEALAAANTQTSEGEYVFAGAQSDTAPFDATGAYAGDGAVRFIETSERATQQVSVSGQVLTAASGVDILPALEALAVALDTNDVPGIQAGLGVMQQAVGQVSRARSFAGSAAGSLNQVNDARDSLEISLDRRLQWLEAQNGNA